MATRYDSAFITNCTFTNNSAASLYGGGVMFTEFSFSFDITNSTFINNSVTYEGGVIRAQSGSSFNNTHSTFTNNSVAHSSGVIITDGSSFNIASSIFTYNSAAGGGITHATASSFNIVDSNFYANSYGGIIVTIDCSTHITNGMFDFNLGFLCVFNSNLTFSGHTTLENFNCKKPSKQSSRCSRRSMWSNQKLTVHCDLHRSKQIIKQPS